LHSKIYNKRKGVSMVKTLVAAAATSVVLMRYQPIERYVPVAMVANNAGLVEVALGLAGYYGAGKFMSSWSGELGKGIAAGMVISGANKLVAKYLG
jgi:hypothetical protein